MWIFNYTPEPDAPSPPPKHFNSEGPSYNAFWQYINNTTQNYWDDQSPYLTLAPLLTEKVNKIKTQTKSQEGKKDKENEKRVDILGKRKSTEVFKSEEASISSLNFRKKTKKGKNPQNPDSKSNTSSKSSTKHKNNTHSAITSIDIPSTESKNPNPHTNPSTIAQIHKSTYNSNDSKHSHKPINAIHSTTPTTSLSSSNNTTNNMNNNNMNNNNTKNKKKSKNEDSQNGDIELNEFQICILCGAHIQTLFLCLKCQQVIIYILFLN